jgi:hypothetical protein
MRLRLSSTQKSVSRRVGDGSQQGGALGKPVILSQALSARTLGYERHAAEDER